MADHEDDDLAMALRRSMEQHESPESKRSKPGENSGDGEDAPPMEESSDVRNRRMVREMMAAAAEKRLCMLTRSAVLPLKSVENVKDLKMMGKGKGVNLVIGKGISGLLNA